MAMQMKTCIELGNAKGHFTFTIVANPPSVPTIHFSFPPKLPFHSLKMQYIEQDKTENVVQIYDREFRIKKWQNSNVRKHYDLPKGDCFFALFSTS